MNRGLCPVILLLTALLYDVRGDNPGTTPHLQDIFIGRCWDYQQIKYNQLMSEKAVPCEELWTNFFGAFSFKAPCDLGMNNYLEFMDMAKQDLAVNKVMFWSGTYVIAHEYAETAMRFITLEDTLIGYLANSLVWCGSGSDSSGMNMTRCPAWTDCPQEASEAFWAAASATFAKSAKGQVTLMLDGSRPDKPAYSKQSFFSKFELPNLGEGIEVLIIVMHNLDGPIKETCKNGSVLTLKEDVSNHGLPVTCVDDPTTVLHLLCVDDPNARECQLVKRHLYGNGNKEVENYLPLLGNGRPNDRFTY